MEQGWPGLAQYTPAVPADWSPRPRTVQDALDQLAQHTGGSGAATSFVFRPGGTAAPGVYTTPAALKAALLTVDASADKVIVVDTSAGTAHLTAAASPWPLDNATFESNKVDILTLDAGCTFTGGTSTLRLRNIAISIDAASVAPIWTPATPAAALDLQTAVLQNASATPWIDVAAGVTLEFTARVGSSVAVGTQVKIENGAGVQTAVLDGSFLRTNSFVHGAAAGGTLQVSVDGASQPFVSQVQDNANLAATFVSLDPQPTFVLQTGGTPGGNRFATWDAMMAAADFCPGDKWLEIDNSVADAHMTNTRPWNLDHFTITARNQLARNLIVDQGASYSFDLLTLQNVVFQNNSTVTPCVLANLQQSKLRLYSGTMQCNAAAAPMFDVPNTAGTTNMTVELWSTASLNTGSGPIFQGDRVGATNYAIRAFDASVVQASVLTGAGNFSVTVSAEATYSGTQPGVTGIVTETIAAKAAQVGYTPATAANWNPQPTLASAGLDQLAAQNFDQAAGLAGTGTPTVAVVTGNITKAKSGKVLVIGNVAGTTSAATTVTLQLVRDAATNIGSTITETTLSAGDGFHGSVAWVDNLPDNAAHTYKLSATATAGNILTGSNSSVQITAVEL